MGTTFSIRSHLLLLVLAAAIPPAAAIAWDLHDDLHKAETSARNELRTLAAAMVSGSGARIATARHSLEWLAAQKLTQRLDPGDCAQDLREVTRGRTDYLDAFTTNAAGEVLCGAAGPTRERSVAGQPWFEAFRQAQAFHVSTPRLDPAFGQPVSVISIPVKRSDGALLGAVHLRVSPDAFDPRLPAAFLPPGLRYGFLDPERVLIWRNENPGGLIGQPVNDPGARKAVAEHGGEVEALSFDGIPRFFSVLPMPGSDWVAFAGVPTESLEAGVRKDAIRGAGAALVALGLLVLFALAVARRISAPIAELEKVADAVRRGDLGVKAAVDGPRDIAAVAVALNAMIDSTRRSEAELRAFLENSAAIAWLKDEQGRTVFASRNYLRRFKLTAAQVLGKTDAEIWPQAQAAQLERNDREVLAGGGSREFVERISNPDGSTSSWLSNKFGFVDADGRRLVGGLAVDLSAVEQAERARQLSAAQLNTAFGASPIGMALISLDGRFLRVNASFCALLGRTEAELLSTGPAALTHPDDLQRDLEFVAELIGGLRDGYQTEKRYLLQDGRELWVQLNVSLVKDAGGGPLHCLSQVQDITQRKAVEASSRLAVVGTLAAGAAHEINNPLTYLLGNLAFVQEELAGLAPLVPAERHARVAQALEALAEAHRGAQRIAGIVAGLKTFSRHNELTVAPTDVGKVMESALQLTHTQRCHQAVTVTRISSAPLVRASAPQLEQVFINLLVNAAQAIPEGAAPSHRITVTVRASEHGEAIAEVQDTGIGMSAEVRTHLFEPFFTTRPVGAGTGLGLPTCHGIITSCGGRIEVESEPGRGSTFRVVLPGLLGETSTPSTPPPEALFPLPLGHRVLVVDDDPPVARELARVLRGGPVVVTINDSREALRQLARGEHFDLVICDVMMPSLAGEEFQKQLRPLQPALADSMLFVTGGAFTQAATAFLSATPNTCVTKPVDQNELRRLVAVRLDRVAAIA